MTLHTHVATLHTNSSKDTLYRIINAVGMENKDNIQTQLSQCLVGILSQQLLMRAKSQTQGALYARDRIAVPEILLTTDAVKSQIRSGKIEQIDSTLQTSGSVGMRTRNRSLEIYVHKGLITQQEANKFRKANQ